MPSVSHELLPLLCLLFGLVSVGNYGYARFLVCRVNLSGTYLMITLLRDGQISRSKTQNLPRVNAGFIKHTFSQMEDFVVTCQLVLSVPHLLSGSCSSSRAFGLGYGLRPLLLAPHLASQQSTCPSPCLRLCFYLARGLPPRKFCAMSGTHVVRNPRRNRQLLKTHHAYSASVLTRLLGGFHCDF